MSNSEPNAIFACVDGIERCAESGLNDVKTQKTWNQNVNYTHRVVESVGFSKVNSYFSSGDNMDLLEWILFCLQSH